MIRTVWVAFVAVVVTLWYGIQILWAAWRRTPGLARICERNPRAWSRAILRAAGVDVRFEGMDRLRTPGPRVLVANHSSWFDVPALAGFVPGPYRFVAKKELATVPVFGPAWRACGHISVDRHDRDAAIDALERARRRIHADDLTMVMFPEGTRSVTGALQPFKKGAFVVALQAGVPVVPVAILGSRAIMRKHAWRIRPGTIMVRVGDPISVDGLTMDDRDELVRRAWEAVQALLVEAGAGEAPGRAAESGDSSGPTGSAGSVGPTDSDRDS